MGLADGDLYVSGSILSFQQMKRIYQNFRAATVPSNLQAGALWSDSDDDRLWHQGASELLEVFTEKTTLTFENLLSNSGFGVWSQSDANKGLATLNYDAGNKNAGTAPSVGDVCVATSGATGKVISYTTATGDWATGDATGVIQLGAVTGLFNDNETVTFGGVETAVVNQPDGAVGADGIVKNGAFVTDVDPPNDWTAQDSVLTTEGAGQVGNCLMIANVGANAGYAKSGALTVEVGKIYKFSFYFKKGTATHGIVYLGTTSEGAQYWNTGALTDVAWTQYTITFEATSTNLFIDLRNGEVADGVTAYFDEVSLYEITPCCTAGGTLAFDGWTHGNGVHIYRQHNDGGTLTKGGSFYSLRVIPLAAAEWIRGFRDFYDNEEWSQQFAGRTVTFKAWAKTSTASHFRLRLSDSVDDTYSSYHTGGGAWEWLEVTKTISASTTEFSPLYWFSGTPAVNGDTIVYISQPMLVFGSHIGEGNYQPKQGEIVWLENDIYSNYLNSKTGASDEGYTLLNLEADTDALIPKGAKMLVIKTGCNDSGSAGTACFMQFQKDATVSFQYINNLTGLANDSANYFTAQQALNDDGDVEYRINASGAGTFDIIMCRFVGVQLN